MRSQMVLPWAWCYWAMNLMEGEVENIGARPFRPYSLFTAALVWMNALRNRSDRSEVFLRHARLVQDCKEINLGRCPNTISLHERITASSLCIYRKRILIANSAILHIGK